LYYNHFLSLILRQSFKENSRNSSVFELDESYFGAKRVRGKRGVEGLPERLLCSDCLRGMVKSLLALCITARKKNLCRFRRSEGSTIHTDGWKAYDGLIVNGYDPCISLQQRICLGEESCQRNRSLLELRQEKIGEIQRPEKREFLLHLKESEFRITETRISLGF
jgi:hypothetical protein